MGNCCISKHKKPRTKLTETSIDPSPPSINIHNISSQEHNLDMDMLPSKMGSSPTPKPKASQIKLNRGTIGHTNALKPAREPASITDLGGEGKVEMSFMRVGRNSQQSFDVFGFSGNMNNTLRENVKGVLREGPSRISGRDMMMMSYEDEEVLKALRGGEREGIGDLKKSMKWVSSHLQLSRRSVVIGEGTKSEFENSSFPNAFKKRYLNILEMNQRDRKKNEMKSRRSSFNNGSKSVLNTLPDEEAKLDPNQNLIKEEEWDIDNEIVAQMKIFIRRNQAKYLDVDMWNFNVHEVQYKKNILSDMNQEHNRLVDELLLSKRNDSIKFFPKEYETKLQTIREPPETSRTMGGSSNNTSLNFHTRRESRFKELTKESMFTVMRGTPVVENINYASFVFNSDNRSQSSGFLAALVSMVNFDEKFGTKTLQRLIYPHYKSSPCRSISGIHFVKVMVNGVRRCFPVSSSHDSMLFFTTKREIYPELLMKPLRVVYETENIHKIEPNRIIYRFLGWIPQNMQLIEIGNEQECFEKIRVNFGKFLIMVSLEYRGKIVPIIDFIKGKKKPKRQIRVFLPMEHQNSDHINQKLDYDSNSRGHMQVPSFSRKESNKSIRSNRLNRSASSNKSLVKLDWEMVYHENPEAKIFINWNPALSHYRKSIHFRVFPTNFHSDSFVSNPLFNYYKKTQLLLSLNPREVETESRIIIERHRQLVNKTLYQVNIELHPYSDFRITSPTGIYKKINVREDEEYDIVEDTMIFSASTQYDHYILTVEAIPLALLQAAQKSTGYFNKKDQLMSADSQNRLREGQLKIYQDLVFTMHFYSAFEASLIEVPFKEVTQWTKLRVPRISGVVFELDVKTDSDMEIRLEGREHLMYGVKISKSTRSRENSMSEDLSYESEFDDEERLYLWRTPKSNRRGAVLSFNLPSGAYMVHFLESPKRKSRRQSELVVNQKKGANQNSISQRRSKKITADRFSPEPNSDYAIEIRSFGESLFGTFEASMEKIRECRKILVFKNGVEMETRKVKKDVFMFSASWKEEMSIRGAVIGEWNERNLHGIGLYDFPREVYGRESERFSLKNSMKPTSESIYALQKFHRNPGFILKVESGMNAQVVVEIRDERVRYKIAVFEIMEDFGLKAVLKPDRIYWGDKNTSDVFVLKNPSNGFLIVVPVLSQQRKTSFKIAVHGDKPILSLTPAEDNFCNLPWTEEFRMIMKSGRGGKISDSNFLFNEGVSLSIGDPNSAVLQNIFAQVMTSSGQNEGHEPSKSEIEGSRPSPSPDDIGLYLFKNKGKRSGLWGLDSYHFDPYACTEFMQKGVNSFFASIPSGEYILVPTRRNKLGKGQGLVIDLRVYSSAEFVMQYQDLGFVIGKKNEEVVRMNGGDVHYGLSFMNEEGSYILVLENENIKSHKLHITIEENQSEKILIDRQIVIKSENFWHFNFESVTLSNYSVVISPFEKSLEKIKLKVISDQKNSFNLQRISIIN